jgi:hypothetical protein
MVEDITMLSNPDMCWASPDREEYNIAYDVAIQVSSSSSNGEISGDPGEIQFSKNVSRR